jgi:DNA-directed RNA polymerase subunit alpha
VERARIGQQTDFDRLVMEIWTDGAIEPEEALSEAAKLLLQHLSLIAGVEATTVVPEAIKDESIPAHVFDVPIEDLELSVRAYNCLKRAGIVKVGEVIQRLEKGTEGLLSIRNFGQKSLDELMDQLNAKGFLEHVRLPAPDAVEAAPVAVELDVEDLGDDSSIDIDVDALLAAMTSGGEAG